MILLYSGTPGSGKSLHLAKILYDRIKLDNCFVIGNFEFNVSEIKGKKRGRYIFIDNDRLSPERLIKFSNDYRRIYLKGKPIKEGRFTLVIDESQIIFNARDWHKSGRDRWTSFFTQHRKFGFDIILVAQFDRMIDCQIRSLIEYQFIHRKINNYGIAGKIIGLTCGGSLFVAVKIWYPIKMRIGAVFFRANMKYYRLYDTYKMFNVQS